MFNSIKTGTNGSIQKLNFDFNEKGQLTDREDGSQLTENFNYDAMDRLTSSQVTGQTLFNYNYQATGQTDNGNIYSTTLAGNYIYDTNHPHAVSTLTGASGSSQSGFVASTVNYNAENKVSLITSGTYGGTEYKNDFTYGVNGNRFKVNCYENNSITRSKIYIGNSEFGYNASGSLSYKRTIIYAPTGVCAVYQDSGNVQTFYYIHTDYLGSWLAITNSTGSLTNKYSYDAWGRPRNPYNWQLKEISTASPHSSLSAMQPRFDRGYTGHEMMCVFGLINMNGRLYDPYVQRFLSPDIAVQNSGDAQNYNRYSYCLNNPLRYTDPTGYYRNLEHHTPPQRKKDCDGGGGGRNRIYYVNGYPYYDDRCDDREMCEKPRGSDVYSGSWGNNPSHHLINTNPEDSWGYGNGSPSYTYDYTTGEYIDDRTGETVSFDEVNSNVIEPNSRPATFEETVSILWCMRVANEMNNASQGGAPRLDALQSIDATSVSATGVPSGLITSSPMINIENNDEVSISVAQLVYIVAATYVGKKVYNNLCSNWVEKVYSICENGFEVHKRANDFADHDELVVTTNPVPGDIVQWDRSPRTGHVAIYAGDDQIITTTTTTIGIYTINGFRSGQPTRYFHYVGN
jgi:RHS repeat-associated protein